MTFGATTVPKLKFNGKKEVSQRPLRHLDAVASPISKLHLDAIAKFLFTTFPQLVSIDTMYEELENQWGREEHDNDEQLAVPEYVFGCHQLWKDVEDVLSRL